MKKSLANISLLLILGLAAGCAKEVDNGISNVPAIEIRQVSPLTIEEFDGNVKVFLKYQDGDGDLGYPEADSLSLEVWDARLAEPDWYYVPALAPVGEVLSIKGELEITLNGTFILGNGTSETTTFTMRIHDRAGNWSNTVETPTITIVEP
ncbi:MAG: hypothetical protein J4F31_05855 [Flavobacteriales bacterium]|nr:hypothetical protein [Flavobacteriales bacterium]